MPNNAKPSTRRWLNIEDKIALRQKLMVVQGGLCAICGEPMVKGDGRRNQTSATIEHIIPHSAKGDYCPFNICLAHKICNSVRSDADFYKFKERNGESLAKWCRTGWAKKNKPSFIFDANYKSRLKKLNPKSKTKRRPKPKNIRDQRLPSDDEFEKKYPILFDIGKSGKIHWR